jgi:predicted enzyme related to lactoylglutathione lyase
VSAPIAVEGFHFVMYLTDDLKRARTFYESLFDLKPGEFANDYFVEYELPDGGAFALGNVPGTPRTPSGGAMFGVPDSEAAIARVVELGGSLIARYGGEHCSTGWCMDTEGNPFGVHQRTAS